MAMWQSVDLKSAQLTPRIYPAVSCLNSQEIVIMGGQDKEHESMSDVCLYNTKTFATTCVKETDSTLQFMADGNQCTQLLKNTVVTLVQDFVS